MKTEHAAEMMRTKLHYRVAPLLVKAGEYHVANQEIAKAMGVPSGLLDVLVLFHSEAEMKVWQDMARESRELANANISA